jgi:hypothetical protein
VAKYNTTFRLKVAKEETYVAFGKITKDVWTKAEEHVVKIEKEYCKENCIDRSVIEPIIIKVVLYLATKPLTCAHINSIGLSSQCRTGVLNTSCTCTLAILSTEVFFVLCFHIMLFWYQ